MHVMLKERLLKKESIAHIASLTCFVHCIIAPFLIVLSPVVGHAFHNHVVELSILLFSLICGIFVISQGYCQHKRKHIVFLYSLGAFFWILHSAFDYFHIHHGEQLLLLIGSLFVIGSYYFNHKLLKCCPKKH